MVLCIGKDTKITPMVLISSHRHGAQRFVRYGLLLFSLLLPTIFPLKAQQNSHAARPDSLRVPTPAEQVRDITGNPFAATDSAIRAHLTPLMLYHELAMRKKAGFPLSLAERLDLWQEKARASLLLGTHQALAITTLGSSDDGILPLLDVSVAHLDSAEVFYGKVTAYSVSGLDRQLRRDSTFAGRLSHRLDSVRLAIGKTASFEPVKMFDLWQAVRSACTCSGDAPEIDKGQAAERSLARWFYDGALRRQKREHP